MDEDSLRAFASVCRTGNITRTAIALHRSQSALSRRLAQLEKRVGTPLLERIPGGVRPTPSGDAFLAHVDAALASLEDGRRAARALVTADVGPVAVTIVGSLATGWVAVALRRFAEDHPSVTVLLQTANSNEVVDLVRRAESDVGIGYGHSTAPGLSSQVLFHDPLSVVCSPQHSLAGRDVGTLAALRDETWFAFAERQPRAETNARFIAGVLASAGVPAGNIRTIDSLTAQQRLIEAGFGIGLLAWSNVADDVAAGRLAVVAMADTPVVEVWMTTRAGGLLTHATQSLIAQLERAATDRAER